MKRGWRVFGTLLAGALAAAVLAPGQLAAWADAHTDRPGGEALAAALHEWDDLLAPLNRARDWLHDQSRNAVDRQF